MSNPQPESWNQNNLIKNKLKKKYETQSLTNSMFMNEIKQKKSINKRDKKNHLN
jgi:hypothetical protein